MTSLEKRGFSRTGGVYDRGGGLLSYTLRRGITGARPLNLAQHTDQLLFFFALQIKMARNLSTNREWNLSSSNRFGCTFYIAYYLQHWPSWLETHAVSSSTYLPSNSSCPSRPQPLTCHPMPNSILKLFLSRSFSSLRAPQTHRWNSSRRHALLTSSFYAYQ